MEHWSIGRQLRSLVSVGVLIIVALSLAGCGGGESAQAAGTNPGDANGMAIDNSAIADGFRISLVGYTEGKEALTNMMTTFGMKHTLNPRGLPGNREGWKTIEAQFAIENLSPDIRRAPELCAVFTDTDGFTRVIPDKKGCGGRACTITYGFTGPRLQPDFTLITAGRVRYSTLRVYGEVPSTMAPVVMKLFTSQRPGDCASMDMQTMWGEYDFTKPMASVTYPFDEMPADIPDISNSAITVNDGTISVTIGNLRLEKDPFGGSNTYVLTADVTFANNGGADYDASRFPIAALTTHESGKSLGRFTPNVSVVPPGVPKTYELSFGYVNTAYDGGTWFYVLFLLGDTNLAQARIAVPN